MLTQIPGGRFAELFGGTVREGVQKAHGVFWILFLIVHTSEMNSAVTGKSILDPLRLSKPILIFFLSWLY